MKVNELFEAVQGSPGQAKTLARGAYYKPGYLKVYGGKIRGSVPDWLRSMGVTSEDVAKAYTEVKKTPEYHAILDLGMSDESGDREIKNGTLNFVGHIDEVDLNDKVRSNRLRYKILANGKIDVISPNDWNRYDLPVPKPVIVKADPVQTVVKTMTNSLKRLHIVLSKRMEKAKKHIQRVQKK